MANEEALPDRLAREAVDAVYAQVYSVVRMPRAERENVVRACAAAIRLALDEAKKAVCRGCDAEWTIDLNPDYTPDVMHVIPVELREPPTEYAKGTHYACDAAAIEALRGPVVRHRAVAARAATAP